MYINFVRGPSKWYGLADDAAEFGFIVKGRAQVTIAATGEVVPEAQLYTDKVFSQFFDALSDKVYEKLRFKTFDETNENEEMASDLKKNIEKTK